MATSNSITQEPRQTWPPDGWLTKAEAAKRLGLSESRTAALGGARGPITTKRERAASGQMVTLFHAGDLERFLFQREHPEEVSKLPVETAFTDLAKTGMMSVRGLPRVEAETLKPWVTIDQAAEITGLPASDIRHAVEFGELPARDCGPRPGGKWRIKRSDLDALQGQR